MCCHVPASHLYIIPFPSPKPQDSYTIPPWQVTVTAVPTLPQPLNHHPPHFVIDRNTHTYTHCSSEAATGYEYARADPASLFRKKKKDLWYALKAFQHMAMAWPSDTAYCNEFLKVWRSAGVNMMCPRGYPNCCLPVRVIYLAWLKHMEEETGKITGIKYFCYTLMAALAQLEAFRVSLLDGV